MPSARSPWWCRLVVLAAAAAAVLVTPAAVPSPGAVPPVDHFLCYTLSQPPKAHLGLVYTRDQFDAALVPTKMGAFYRFCNPAEKEFAGQTTPIHNPALHLTIYTMQVGRTPSHQVVVSNQFGDEQTLTIGRPFLLAVPSSKNAKTPPSPRLLSHFKCYPVTASQQRAELSATVEDQWRRVGVGVTAAKLFCNPTLKYVRGPPAQRYKIIDRDTHLVCYGVKASEFSKTLIATNQFGRATLTVVRPDRLCVPSKKLKHTP